MFTWSTRHNNRVQKFTPGEGRVHPGAVGRVVASGEGQFNLPWGITTGLSMRNVYVADWRNDRVQKFSLPTGNSWLPSANPERATASLTVHRAWQ